MVKTFCAFEAGGADVKFLARANAALTISHARACVRAAFAHRASRFRPETPPPSCEKENNGEWDVPPVAQENTVRRLLSTAGDARQGITLVHSRRSPRHSRRSLHNWRAETNNPTIHVESKCVQNAEPETDGLISSPPVLCGETFFDLASGPPIDALDDLLFLQSRVDLGEPRATRGERRHWCKHKNWCEERPGAGARLHAALLQDRRQELFHASPTVPRRGTVVARRYNSNGATSLNDNPEYFTDNPRVADLPDGLSQLQQMRTERTRLQQRWTKLVEKVRSTLTCCTEKFRHVQYAEVVGELELRKRLRAFPDDLAKVEKQIGLDLPRTSFLMLEDEEDEADEYLLWNLAGMGAGDGRGMLM